MSPGENPGRAKTGSKDKRAEVAESDDGASANVQVSGK